MKKPAKRYSSAQEITELIDKYHRDMNEMGRTACYLEEKHDAVSRDLAEKIRKRIHWRELRCEKLRRALAEFNTIMLFPDEKGVKAI